MKNNFFCKNQFITIYENPYKGSLVSSQILYGEKFKILSRNKDWLKIKTSFDNYVGYIKSSKYEDNFIPKYKIFKIKAKVFKKPILKKINETTKFLTFSSKISSIRETLKFVEYEENKWIKKNDIKKIDHIEKNYLKIFKSFLKTKYVWGQKNYRGIDCSAILQLYFYYNGKFYPRDTKDQIKYSKKIKKKKQFKKGDIIFWKGHVAICLNSKELIHAYGPKKKVLIMPIENTIKKIQETAKLQVKKISNINS